MDRCLEAGCGAVLGGWSRERRMGLYSLRVIEVSEAETRTMKSPSVSSSDDLQGGEIIFFLEDDNRGWNI